MDQALIPCVRCGKTSNVKDGVCDWCRLLHALVEQGLELIRNPAPSGADAIMSMPSYDEWKARRKD